MGMTMPGRPSWEHRAVQRSAGGVQLRSADRAQRVVAAVRDLASEHGSAEFTMAEVAEASGVPLRTLYRQFPGRDELVLALLEEEARLGVQLLGEALGEAADPWGRLQAFVLGLWDFMERGSGYASILVREHLRLAKEHPDETRMCLEPFVDLMVALLREAEVIDAPPPGPASEPPADAFVMFSVLLAHMQAVLLFRPDLESEDAAEGVWQLFRSMNEPTLTGRPSRSETKEE